MSAEPQERDPSADIASLLRRKFRLAGLLIVLPLVAATAGALLFLGINSATSRYTEAFLRLTEASVEFESHLHLAELDPWDRDLHVANARASFREMLLVYGALRLADPDGGKEPSDIARNSALHEQVTTLLDRHGNRIRSMLASLGLAGGEMPEALALRWEVEDWEDERAEKLEVLYGRLLLAGEPVLDEDASDIRVLIPLRESYGQLLRTRVSERNLSAIQALQLRERWSGRLPAMLMMLLFAFVTASVIIVNAGLIRPLVAHVGEAQRALVEARSRAEADERAKSEFLASMSHEIRTPMNGVIGMAELMAGTSLDTRQRMFVEIIQSSARALLAIINDILDYSKIEAGHLTIFPEPFRLERLAAEPAQLISELAASKGLEVSVRVAPGAPRSVIGDFGRLRQVVTNLLGNAVKFTRAGQVGIDISSEATAETDELVLVVEVRDTGIGIPEDKLSQIFDRFSQIDRSSTREHEGTGLGLAITKGLVELMGGSIEAESVVGRGTVVRFRVPITVDPAADLSTPPPVEVAGRRALVIDDNETNRFIAQELLGAWGFQEQGVSSGREGLRKLLFAAQLGEPFDVVLLDHHMPGMDGEETLRRLRETPEIAPTAVILLTSIVDDRSLAACREIGLDGYVVKPVLGAPLLDAIAEALSRTARPETARPRLAEPAPGETAEAPAEAGPSDGRPRVLIVEDNTINRIVLQNVLQGMNLGFIEAVNGEEAVELFRAKRPALVLMDVSMPVMDGFEATRQIREIEGAEGWPRTPIIGVTAHAMETDRERCLTAGMDDYASKPFNTGALQMQIDRWLDHTDTPSGDETVDNSLDAPDSRGYGTFPIETRGRT